MKFKTLILLIIGIFMFLICFGNEYLNLNTTFVENNSNYATEKGIILVNKENPLPNNFKVENLVDLTNVELTNYDLRYEDIKINAEVYEQMNKMFYKAYEDGITGFEIVSGFRTAAEQKKIFKSTDDNTAAKVNESEHQTGLALDVGSKDGIIFGNTEQFYWLQANCAEYGFILRYPYGKENITGYPYEPWHYRYVGKEHAIEIMKNEITLEEYLEVTK